MSTPSPDAWWFQAFPLEPYASHPPGPTQLLARVAYDISHPRRLARVAAVCEDFGIRVQYSLFECRLEPPEFERLWARLLREMEPSEDRIVAYPLDARCARETRTAGTMICSEQVVCYLM